MSLRVLLGQLKRPGLLTWWQLSFGLGHMVGLTEQVNLRLLWIGDMMRSCSLYILNFTQVFEDWLLEFLERDLGQVLCIVREVERVYVKPDNNSCHLTI